MTDQIAAARALPAKPRPDQIAAAAKVLDEVGEKLDDAKSHIEDDNINPADLERSSAASRPIPPSMGISCRP